jgi:hypothetical protein
LLILSTPERNWFPTHIAAHKNWTTIKLLYENKFIDLVLNPTPQKTSASMPFTSSNSLRAPNS